MSLKELAIKIRNLKPNEYPQFLNALSLEGWYLEHAHLESLYKEFKDDFFCIHFEEKILGFILALRDTQEFGFISNFVILKEFRKRGFGKELFKYALHHLDGYQIALECEKNKEEFYKIYGFSRYYDSVYYVYEKQEEDTSSLNIPLEKECLSTKYIDGYKVVIVAQSYNEARGIFFTLIKNYPLKTKIYIEVTNLEPFLVKLSQDLRMKEFSRKSRMYNKVLA